MPPKKEEKKPEGWNLDATETVIVAFFILFVLSALAMALENLWFSGTLSFFGFRLSGIVDFFRNNVQFFKAIGFALAGVGVIGTFVLNKRADAIWAAEKAKVYPHTYLESQIGAGVYPASAEAPKNALEEKWEKIVEKSESQNPSDWRLAIIEADIMLDDLLEKLHLPGETMGDKLKAVEPSDFTTIESAWEAHKFRNMIAHQGDDFLVNQREIRRVISLYAAVFKEFCLI